MISKINYLNSKPVNMKQSAVSKDDDGLKAQKAYTTTPNNEKGMEALANYGISLVNFTNKINIEPLIPTVYSNIDDIEGERIYTSDGKLYSIVKETPTLKTTYFVPLDNQKVFDYMETVDKNTGKLIRNQHNRIDENGKYSSMYVTTFNPETGKEEMFTNYENGKLEYAGKSSVNKLGDEINITKYYEHGEYYISQENTKSKTYRTMRISGDMNKVDYSEERVTNKGTYAKNVEFYKGLPFNYNESKKTTVPNLIGLEILMDPDLKPAPKFDFKAMEMDIRNSFGEEKRFSNGVLERKKVVIDGEEIEASFNPNNEMIRIVFNNMEIEADGKGVLRVKQKLDEGKTKETFLSELITRVVYHDNGFTKALTIDNKTHKPISYHENKIVNGKEEDVISLYFNDKGVADAIYTI